MDEKETTQAAPTQATEQSSATTEAPKASPLSAKMSTLRGDLAAGKLPAKLEEPALGNANGDPTRESTSTALVPAKTGEVAEAGTPAPVKAGTEETPLPAKESGAAAVEEAEEEPDAALVVQLAPRREGEEPLEIVCANQETADRLRMSIKNGMRRDRYFAALTELNTKREELASLEDKIIANPVLFVVKSVGERFHVDIALHLLSLPGVWEKVAPLLEGWDYEDKRSRAMLELERNRNAATSEWHRDLKGMQSSREQARIINESLEKLIPDVMDDDEAALLITDLRRDTAEYVETNKVANLHPRDLPRILERRLKQYGIERSDAEAALSVEGPPPVRVKTAPSAAAKPAGRKSPPDAAAARETGAKLTQQVENRRAAAAVPGAGAGTTPAAPALPTGQTIRERVQTLRQRMGR